MKSFRNAHFIKYFKKLPLPIQKAARKQYRLWRINPNHPSLNYKPLKINSVMRSIRITNEYRAVGIMVGSVTIMWFWIGSHSDYDLLIKTL